MPRLSLLAAALLALTASHARAADPDLSIDTKRMLAYGTLAVMTGVCKTNMTAAQTAQMNTGMQKAADAQKDMTQEEFTEAMKAVGAQVGENKEQVCAALTPAFINKSLVDAAAGQ